MSISGFGTKFGVNLKSGGVDFRIWVEILSEIEIGGVDFRIWVEIGSEIEAGGVTLENEAYMLGLGWGKKGKC